jgi:dihydroorotase-like cyclic amidohydrolase
VLLDPAASRTVTAVTHSLSHNNPFAGRELKGRVLHTVFRGKFSFKDGKVKNA